MGLRGVGESRRGSRKEMEGYATTDYSSVQERQKRVQRKEKQDRKDLFFCLFFTVFLIINNKKRN